MPFTEEKRRTSHEQKQAQEHRLELIHGTAPVAVCVNCQNPFGINEGVITDEVALCDICSGD